MSRKAALYLRSSKDRSDVSIEAQRKALLAMAAERGLTVLKEYADVVESAKSEYRPAFQQLITDLRQRDRPWQVILMIDHSRLSRQPYVGHVFRYECQRQGVEVLFQMFPELDPISKIILDSTLDAMSVVHSIMSKQKGLAGMAENVHRGFRAGGRAPRGYRLKHLETDAIRDGVPVMKSVLEPSLDAPLVTRYLSARARGIPRSVAARELGIRWSPSSLIGMEWNALTYAGHTVWNRHNETRPEGGYVGKQKMRDREDWHIHRGTHPALITDEEAERLLDQLANSQIGVAVSAAKRGVSPHLLTGVLQSTDGRMWEGWKDRYRVKAAPGLPGKSLPKSAIEGAIVEQITQTLHSEEFARTLLRYARRQPKQKDTTSPRLRRSIAHIGAQIAKTLDLALKLQDPAPALRKVDELEAQRRALQDELETAERERLARAALREITPEQIRELTRGLAEELQSAEQPRLKTIVRTAVDRIVLDPVTLECRVRYRIPVERTLSMASPWRCVRWGTLIAEDFFRIPVAA